jgi:hypothetical protein
LQTPVVVAHVISVQGIQRLTSLIFARTQPKRLGNQIISGAMLAALATAYVDAINHGAVPTIATAWQVPHICPFLASAMVLSHAS